MVSRGPRAPLLLPGFPLPAEGAEPEWLSRSPGQPPFLQTGTSFTLFCAWVPSSPSLPFLASLCDVR